MKEVKLKSGRVLRLGLAPFRDSKALFDAICLEVKGNSLDPRMEVDINFIKDTAMGLIASEKVFGCIQVCMAKCLYNGQRIDEQTFESVEGREDFLEICMHVTKENVLPFMKNLSSKFAPLMKELGLNLE